MEKGARKKIIDVLASPKIWLGIIAVVLMLTLGSILRGLYEISHYQGLGSRARIMQARKSLQPDQVRGWMTFGFINRVFNLPPGYLLEQLGQTDNKYPRISLDEFAQRHHINNQELQVRVVNLIKQYQLRQSGVGDGGQHG